MTVEQAKALGFRMGRDFAGLWCVVRTDPRRRDKWPTVLARRRDPKKALAYLRLAAETVTLRAGARP